MSNRKEDRFPCVGIELMYSPVRGDYVEDLGSEIYAAIGHDMSFSGLSFDVSEELNIDDEIYVLVNNQFQPPERLTAKVCWCKTLDNGQFRIGVTVMASGGVNLATENYADDYINSVDNSGGLSEATLVCPSCTKVSTFEFVENQEGDWGKGIMPLYQCNHCQTTRTIPNILEHNRRLRVTEVKSRKTVFEPSPDQQQPSTVLQRILYVEDEPDIRTISQMALEMVGGFTVEVCSSGKEALEKIEAFKPDLLLLDVMMPDLTGPQTLEKIRDIKLFSQIPAVFMTAKVQTHEISTYKTPHVLGVIPKPFDPMSLASELQELWNSGKES